MKHTWIAVRFHELLNHLLILRSTVSTAARDDRQLVEPSVFLLLIGQQQISWIFVRGKDADRQVGRSGGRHRTGAFRLFTVGIGNVFQFFDASIPHADLALWDLKHGKCADLLLPCHAWRTGSSIIYLISWRFEVEEGFADEHAPATFRVAVFHFDNPSFKRWFLVFAAQQEPGRIATDSVLQNAHPFVNSATRVGR